MSARPFLPLFSLFFPFSRVLPARARQIIFFGKRLRISFPTFSLASLYKRARLWYNKDRIQGKEDIDDLHHRKQVAENCRGHLGGTVAIHSEQAGGNGVSLAGGPRLLVGQGVQSFPHHRQNVQKRLHLLRRKIYPAPPRHRALPRLPPRRPHGDQTPLPLDRGRGFAEKLSLPLLLRRLLCAVRKPPGNCLRGDQYGRKGTCLCIGRPPRIQYPLRRRDL